MPLLLFSFYTISHVADPAFPLRKKALREGGFGSHPPLLAFIILLHPNSDQILPVSFLCPLSVCSLPCAPTATALVPPPSSLTGKSE